MHPHRTTLVLKGLLRGVPACPNVCPPRSLARSLARLPKVIELHNKLFVQGNPVTVKYALARMGKISNTLRVPLVPMEAQYAAEVDRALESAGLLSPSRL